MHNILRQTMRLLLALAIAVSAAGCAALGFTPTPEPVTLKFAMAEGVMPIQQLADEFHTTHPWITIEVVEANAYATSEITQLVRAGGIDVFRQSREAMALVEDGLIAPLDEIQLDAFSNIRDDYYAGLWEALTQQGVQYGIPAAMDIYVAYVLGAEAEARGVSLPAADWEMFDFISFATEMNNWDPAQMTEAALLGFGTDPEGMDPLIFVYRHGGAIVDDIEDPRQPLLDDPLTIEGTQLYADLFTRYQLAPTPRDVRRAFPRGGIYEAQIRGRCATWLGWFSSRGGGTDYLAWPEGWKMYNLPRDQVDLAMGNVEGYYVTASSAHPQEALSFIRFLADRWDAAGKMLPARLSQQQSSAYRETLGDELTAVVDAFPEPVVFLPGTYTPKLETVGTAFYRALSQIIEQDLDAADPLQEAQNRVRATFQ